MDRFNGKKGIYISSNTNFMFELDSAFIESVNGSSFGLEQMSRVAANIYYNTYFMSDLDLGSTSDKSLIGSSLYDLVERFDDFEARMAVTEGGS